MPSLGQALDSVYPLSPSLYGIIQVTTIPDWLTVFFSDEGTLFYPDGLVRYQFKFTRGPAEVYSGWTWITAPTVLVPVPNPGNLWTVEPLYHAQEGVVFTTATAPGFG